MLAETVMHGLIQSGPEFPPQEILKLSIVIIVLSQVLNNHLVPDCVRSNLRGSKFKFFLGGMPLDPPSRHTNLCVCERAFATLLSSCYLPVPPPPPPQLKFPFLCTEILGRTSMHGYSCKRCPIHLALYTCMDGCAHPNL